MAETHAVSDFLVFCVCGLAVSFYAMRRYNTPETNRLTTTRALFLATGAGYVLTSLALFALLSEIVLKPGVLAFLGVSDAQKLVAKYAAPSILAALLLTTLLPNVALVSSVDAWLLKQFQRWGQIPSGVRSLADKLDRDKLLVRESAIGDLQTWIQPQPEIPNELIPFLSSDPRSPTKLALTRELLFFRELERLSREPGYKDAFRSQRADWDTLGSEFRVFAAQSHAFFVLFEHVGGMEEAQGTNALKQARATYDTICAQIHQHMAELLACVLLRVEAYDWRVRMRVRSMGFFLPEHLTVCPLPIGPFVFLGLMIVLGILCTVAVEPAPERDLPLPAIALLIGTTQAIALLTAILPKLRSSAFRASNDGSMPYLGWIASAAAAGVFAFVVERLALGLGHHNLAACLDFRIAPLTPVGPMSALVCLTVTILADLGPPAQDGRARRLVDALVCGLIMTAGIYVFIKLAGMQSATKGKSPDWFPFAFSFVLGFVCGFVGPHIYRAARLGRLPAAPALAPPIPDQIAATGDD